MDSAGQGQFDFNSHCGEDGYRTWQDQRRQAMRQLARRMGLPLEHRVEVWLRGEIRLVGTLKLREQTLFVPEGRDDGLELIVDNVPFTPSEVTSCVALD